MPELIYKGQPIYTGYLNSRGISVATYKEDSALINPVINGQAYKNIPTLELDESAIQITGAEATKTVSFSYDGDGVLSVASSNPSVATASISGSNIVIAYISDGNTTITLSAAEGMQYEAANTSLIVQCRISTPTLAPSTSSLTVMGADGSNTFTVTNTGDGVLSATSSNTTVATVSVSGNTVTVTYVAAGNVTISLNSAATNRYTAATSSVSVTCSRSASSITLSKTSLAISGAAGSGSFTFSYVGDGSITVASSNTSIATVSRNGATVTVTYVNSGSATVTVSIANGTKYAATSASCSISNSKSNPTYTAPTARSLTYTRTNASTITAQALLNAGTITSGHGTIQYSSNNSSWGTSIPTGTNAGTYTVYWRIVGNAKYNDKASASIKVTIAKRTLAVPALSGTTSFTNSDATTRSVSSNGNYNSTYMYTSGTWSASTPGTYTVAWSLRDTANCVWSGNTTSAKSASWNIVGGTVTFWVWFTNGECSFTVTYAPWSSIPDNYKSGPSNFINVQYHYYSNYGPCIRYFGDSGTFGVQINTAGHWGPQNGAHYANLNGNVVQYF